MSLLVICTFLLFERGTLSLSRRGKIGLTLGLSAVLFLMAAVNLVQLKEIARCE